MDEHPWDDWVRKPRWIRTHAETTTMRNSTNYDLLLDRGRKAGLTARELNLALSTCPVRSGEPTSGLNDANGFVSGIDVRGQRISRPVTPSSRN